MEQPRVRVLELFFLLVLIALTMAFYRILQPFILDAVVAAVLATVFHGTYRRIRHRIGDRRLLAGFLALAIVIVTVALPVAIIGTIVYGEVVAAVETLIREWPRIARFLSESATEELGRRLPFLEPYLEEISSEQIAASVRRSATVVSNAVLRFSRRSLVLVGSTLGHAAVVFLLLFFLFVDGDRLVRKVYELLPMRKSEIDQIAMESLGTTSATLKSTIIIGLMEGALGVVLFAAFGISSPFLWGVVITVLSMIPLIGTNLIIVPAGIILMLQGRLWAGVAVALLGLLGVAVTQNVIKPKLLGESTGLHPALILLATIGGIAWLGVIGFLLGPVLVSLFIVIWKQFAIRYEAELATKHEG
ncbi:MAG: AI-2E family transporter [Spirochaetota bacterium]